MRPLHYLIQEHAASAAEGTILAMIIECLHSMPMSAVDDPVLKEFTKLPGYEL